MAKINNFTNNAEKPTVWDKVKDFINTGRQYQVQAIEKLPTYYADRLDNPKRNNFLIREEEAPQPTTLGGMSYSGDPQLNAYLQDIKSNADKAVYDPRTVEKPAILDKVKNFVDTSRQYQVKAIEDTADYYADRLDNPKRNNFLIREEEAPQPTTLGGMSYSGDPQLNAYLQDIKANADKAVYDPRTVEKPAVFNEVKDFVNTGNKYKVQAIEDTAEYYKEEALRKPNTDDTWFQSGSFSDGWQPGDLRRAAQATHADLNMNTISGALRLGESAADSTKMLGAWSYGGLMPSEEVNIYPVYRFSMDARNAEKQRAAEFVAKDLIDEDAIAETIYADYLARNPDLDVERDSFLGTKSRALAKEAGELAAVTVLQAVGVPWWLTTGVNAFGSEAEHAAREGASYDEAATSGLISAGAEILVGTIARKAKGLGKTPSTNEIEKVGAYTSKKLTEELKSILGDATNSGFEEMLANTVKKFGQWLTYQDDKTFRELFWSRDALNEAIEDFASGFVLSFIDPAKQKRNADRRSFSKGEYSSWSDAEGSTMRRQPALTAQQKYPTLPDAYKPPLLPAASNADMGSEDFGRNICSEYLKKKIKTGEK
ncbi:MAG: hypothetical protein E7420_00650 [Ruminococcaceae bacterium]|nr:hypothetical protein [Oscillospiraceae bacterium]